MIIINIHLIRQKDTWKLESYIGMIDNDENETYKNHDKHDDYTRYYNF